jgi:F0F1-type ATP synthase assembly protein I
LTTPEPDSSEPARDLPSFAAFASLGLTIAATVAAFVVLGIWADSALGTAPWCLLAGIVVGCGAATASTIALVRRYL